MKIIIRQNGITSNLFEGHAADVVLKTIRCSIEKRNKSVGADYDALYTPTIDCAIGKPDAVGEIYFWKKHTTISVFI